MRNTTSIQRKGDCSSKRILVIWGGNFENRRTIIDHLYSFERYDEKNNYIYLRMDAHVKLTNYSWIKKGIFDAVIFHYSFFTYRDTKYWESFTALCADLFAEDKSIKIILPQDDYTKTSAIWEFIRRVKIDRVYTVIRPEDYDIMYPKDEIGDVAVETVLTGYVDKRLQEELLAFDTCKTLDIMYRARKLPYEFGKQGQYKYILAELFKEKAEGLKIDIANTRDTKNTLLGNRWITSLASARCTIGCLGGSSVIDPYGLIAEKYKEYSTIKPEASYEEAKRECFPDLVEPLHGAISPRLFEAALTRTTQILMGYDYQGVLIPNVDYIVLEEDFSNIDDVLLKIQDEEYCAKIADNCYRDVIETGKYSYGGFVEKVTKNIPLIHENLAKGEDNKMRIMCTRINRKAKLYYATVEKTKRFLLNSFPNIPFPKYKQFVIKMVSKKRKG